MYEYKYSLGSSRELPEDEAVKSSRVWRCLRIGLWLLLTVLCVLGGLLLVAFVRALVLQVRTALLIYLQRFI